MFGLQNNRKDIVLSLYKDDRTVFRLVDVAMLTGETNLQTLGKKLNYYVGRGKLQNPRKGIYTKPGYKPEEFACRIYTPSYISLEYVLQKNGIVFQYSSQITAVSYLSRNVDVEKYSYRYRKLKASILTNLTGISEDGHVNIAVPERAFLDLLYLVPDYYFDNVNALDKMLLEKLLPVYQSKTLNKRFYKLFQDV